MKHKVLAVLFVGIGCIVSASAQEIILHSGTTQTPIDLTSQMDSITFDLSNSQSPLLVLSAKSGVQRHEVKKIDSITAKPAPVKPDTGAIPLGGDWLHVGDSQTAGRAEGSVLSPGIAFKTLWTSSFGQTPALWAKGISGQPLSATNTTYSGRTEKTSATWVHFQESGDQNEAGQRTATEFGATFLAMVRAVRAGSPSAVISTETAYSFQRESQQFRNWTEYNTELRAKVAELKEEGIRVIVAETDRNIKDLVAKLGFATVILPDGGHYSGVGNLLVALSYFDALGYDVSKLNLSGVTEVTAAHKAECLAIIAKY